MLQIAVCDDEKLYLNEVLQILHDTLGDTPNRIQTFQNSAALLAAVEEDGYIPKRVRLDSILCIERLKHKTIVHTDEGDIETAQFPKTLIDSGGVQADLIRCHQSFWVCSKAIAAMEREQFKLRDGSFVPISRTYRNESRKAFFELLAGTVKQEIKV